MMTLALRRASPKATLAPTIPPPITIISVLCISTVPNQHAIQTYQTDREIIIITVAIINIADTDVARGSMVCAISLYIQTGSVVVPGVVTKTDMVSSSQD